MTGIHPTADEHEQYVFDHAVVFRATRFLGGGRIQRVEAPTVAELSDKLAVMRVPHWLVYAEDHRQQGAHVGSWTPNLGFVCSIRKQGRM